MEHLIQLFLHHEIVDTMLIIFLVVKQLKAESNQLKLIEILEKELQSNNRLLTIIAKENGWLK